MTTFTKEQLQQIEAAAKEALWPVVWSEKKARAHFSKKITPEVVLEQARIALLSLCTDTRAQPVIPDEITSASAPEVFEIAAEAERLGLRGTYASYAVGWNAYRAAMLKAQQNEPQNIPENIPAPLDAQDLELYVDMLENSDSDDEDGELNNTQLIVWLKELQRRRALSAQPVISEQPEFYTKPDRFLPECLKPEEISGERRNSRIAELMGWFDRYYSGKANPKWLKPHVAELCYYILTVPQLSAQPVSEPYKLPQGWIKGQFAYQDLFNAIGAAVVSKHPSIEISVKAFEDSMLAAAPTQESE